MKSKRPPLAPVFYASKHLKRMDLLRPGESNERKKDKYYVDLLFYFGGNQHVAARDAGDFYPLRWLQLSLQLL